MSVDKLHRYFKVYWIDKGSILRQLFLVNNDYDSMIVPNHLKSFQMV